MIRLMKEYNGDARWKPSRDTIDLIFKWVDNSETKNPYDLEDLYGISDYDVKYSDSSKTAISIYAAMDFTVNGEEYRCDETFYIQPDYNRDTYKMYSDDLGMRTVESTTDVLDLIAVTLNDGRKKYMKELQRTGEKTESIKRNSKRSIKEELDDSSYEDLKYEVYRAAERAFNSFVRNNEMNVSDDEITSIMREVTAKLLESVIEI